MSETPITYGLTNFSRVKDRLSMKESNFDTVFNRMIASMTDLIEGECGKSPGNHFLETTYTNEVYSIYNPNARIFALRNTPVASVSSVQYRFGLKSNPNWTEFNTDDWEIMEDGKAGLIRIWGFSHAGNIVNVNALRFTYVAGFKVDWDNVGSATLHTLPYDLTDLCERMVVKVFKKRNDEGKSSESFQGGSINWDKNIFTETDKDILARYRRLPQFI